MPAQRRISEARTRIGLGLAICGLAVGVVVPAIMLDVSAAKAATMPLSPDSVSLDAAIMSQMIQSQLYQAVISGSVTQARTVLAPLVAVDDHMLNSAEAFKLLRTRVHGEMTVGGTGGQCQGLSVVFGALGLLPIMEQSGSSMTMAGQGSFSQARFSFRTPTRGDKAAEPCDSVLVVSFDLIEGSRPGAVPPRISGMMFSYRSQREIRSELKSLRLRRATMRGGTRPDGVTTPRVTPQFNGDLAVIQSVTSTAGEAFVHRPVYPYPPHYTPRLTKAVCEQWLGVDLFSEIGGAGSNAQAHTGYGPIFRDVCFVNDPYRNRIIYGDLAGEDSWLAAYGPRMPDRAHEVGGAEGIAANNGEGEYADFVNLYVSEHLLGGGGRLSRLDYDFGTRQLVYGDSLSLDSDDLRELNDVCINTAGTRVTTQDDWLWTVGGRDRAELLKYLNGGPRGVQMRFGGRDTLNAYASLFYELSSVACGRNFGDHNDLIYVVDERLEGLPLVNNERVVCLRDIGTTLTVEAVYDLPGNWYAAGMTVDQWGSVYIIGTNRADDPAWILKLSPDLTFVSVLSLPAGGGEGCYRPQDISNPLSTPAINGYADLFISEDWSDSTGGQWYLIGTEITSFGAQSYWNDPSLVQVAYSTTDAMNEGFRVWRWSRTIQDWEFLVQYQDETVPPGLITASLQLPDGGDSCVYLVELEYSSRYSNWYGEPVNTGTLYAFVSNCVCSCSENGDFSQDGIINVDDVLNIIDFVLGAGSLLPELQECPQNGDWNCDAQINIQDVVATVDYSFRRGPAPCDQCQCGHYPYSCPQWPPQ